MKHFFRFLLTLLAAVLLLHTGSGEEQAPCHVTLLRDPRVVAEQDMYTLEPGQDLDIRFILLPKTIFVGCDYPQYTVLSETLGEDGLTEINLRLHRVTQSVFVTLTLNDPKDVLYVDPMQDPSAEGSLLRVTEAGNSPRMSSLPWTEQFQRDGYLAVAWNTSPDGQGDSICFGSRFGSNAGHESTLYVQWLACTPESFFQYELRPDGAWITRCETYTDLVIPPALGGAPVTGLCAGAFGQVRTDILALPACLHTVEEGAFDSLDAKNVYLFDSLENFSALSFGEARIQTLHLNRAGARVSADQEEDLIRAADLLCALQGRQKLVLFSKTAWDTQSLSAAFPEWHAVRVPIPNAANPRPFAEILLSFLEKDDVLLSSPDTDCAVRQFLSSTVLDADTFSLLAGDPGLLTRVDLRGYEGVFEALQAYLKGPPSPSSPASQVHTALPNSDPSMLYDSGSVRDLDWASLGRFFLDASEMGVKVLFAFPPRLRSAVRGDGASLTEAARLRLSVPVLLTAEEALLDSSFFEADGLTLCPEGAQRITALLTQRLAQHLAR